jgi:hypothetical protein
LILAGCGDSGDGVPAAPSPGTAGPAELPGRPSFQNALRSSDATYTVMMRVFTEPNHSAEAARWRDRLSEALGWKGLTVVSQTDYSVLYWGQFSSPAAAQDTLDQAKAYRTHRGDALFTTAMITVLPGSDPGQAAWDLASSTGAYSLLVADFENVPDQGYVGRIEDAVAYCRELRSKGLEAYYYHGPSTSSVTIGSFGPEAIRWEQHTVNSPLDAKPVTVSRRVIVDPQLQALQQQFPHRLWNLREVQDVVRDSAGGEVRRSVPASIPIRVPGKGSADADDAFNRNPRAGHGQPR